LFNDFNTPDAKRKSKRLRVDWQDIFFDAEEEFRAPTPLAKHTEKPKPLAKHIEKPGPLGDGWLATLPKSHADSNQWTAATSLTTATSPRASQSARSSLAAKLGRSTTSLPDIWFGGDDL